MLNLFVIDAKDDGNVPVVVRKATQRDFEATSDWQTDWRSPEASMTPAVAFCVPKKNRSTSHVNAAAAISAVAAEKMLSSITVPSPCLLY